jgi:hypothetical protein
LECVRKGYACNLGVESKCILMFTEFWNFKSAWNVGSALILFQFCFWALVQYSNYSGKRVLYSGI